MANVEVKIQLQDTVEDTIKRIRVEDVENVTSRDEVPVNNVSIYHPMKNAMNWQEGFLNLSTKNNGVNMKSWATGSLSLADGYVGGSNTKLMRQGGYNGYVFGAVPENKQFELTIRVSGSDIDSIIIYGDKEANQFPTKAYLDSNSSEFIYSDDPVWAIKFPNAHTNHSITFLEWNRANYNACITFVAVLKNHLKFDSSWISNLESLSQSTPNANQIDYKSIPNSGEIELIDKEKEFKDYVIDGIIDTTNLKLDFFANGKKFQTHLATDIEYYNNSASLSIDLSDILTKYDYEKYGGRLLTLNSAHKTNYSKTLYEFFEEIMFSMGYTESQILSMLNKKIICGNDNVERTIKEYFDNIRVYYPYLKSGNFRETLNKFCGVAQLQLLQDNNGELMFLNARPIVTEGELENVINIPLKNQMNSLEMSLIKKNKYDGVNLTYNKIQVNPESVTTINKTIYQTLPTPMTGVVLEDKEIEVYAFKNVEDIDPLWGLTVETSEESNTSVEFISYVNDPNNEYIFGLYKYKSNDVENFTGIKISGTVKRFRNLVWESNVGLFYPLQESDIFGVDHFSFNRNAFDTAFDYGENLKPNRLHNYIVDDGKAYVFFNTKKNGLTVYNVVETDGTITPYFILPIRKIDLSQTITSTGETDYTLYGLLCTNYNLNINNNVKKENFVNYNYGGNLNILSMSTNNELLQNYTTYMGKPIIEVIAETILNDYKDGIYSATIKINCTDLYDLYGQKVKDWASGDIININDIVKIEGNDILWKVKGRRFEKVGVPFITLELQEIKQ